MQIHFDPLVTIPQIVTIATLAHTFLPPWEAFSDFPELQKKYKLFVYIIGFIAGNARSSLYKSLSTNDGAQPSIAAIKSGNGDINKVIVVPGNGKVIVQKVPEVAPKEEPKV